MEEISPLSNVISLLQLSELTGIGEQTLKKRAQKGTVRCVKAGRDWLFWLPDWNIKNNHK